MIAIWRSSMFVGVEGALIYSLFKFQRRKGRVAAQIHGNTRLEIGWTVGAAVILVSSRSSRSSSSAAIKNPRAVATIDASGKPVASLARRRPVRLDRPADAARAATKLKIDVNGQQYVWRYSTRGAKRPGSSPTTRWSSRSA